MRILNFDHPDPLTNMIGPRLRPVFLPFAGCPHRCAFCGQHYQTGQRSRPLDEILARLHRDLTQELERSEKQPLKPLELAFYGGTFTALPGGWPERFLALAAEFRAAGLVTRVRCSTRPDCTDPDLLNRLKDLGLDMVELGIQSFDNSALTASGRGYPADIARQGCENVRAAGLGLGIQLMPGLPGDQPGTFQQDVGQTIALQPDTVRLYPCLVIDHTPLAETWRSHDFHPWQLPRARQELSLALHRLWLARIPVIRIGLHPEPELLPHILAGPWHPALGQMVRSLAIFDHIRAQALPLCVGPKSLRAPQRFSGEIMGHGAELREAWQKAGYSISHYGGKKFILAKK